VGHRPLTSDGPGLALAAGAVAAAPLVPRGPSLGRALAAGALLGGALSVKSLLLGAVVPVAWPSCPTAATSAPPAPPPGTVSVAVALPWGLGNVWDQAFRYHLEAAGPRTPLGNLRKVISTLGDRDLPVIVAALASAALSAVARSRTRHRRNESVAPPSPSGFPTLTVGFPLGVRLVAAWLATTVLVLAVEHPLWRSHVAHLIPPAALLITAGFDRLPRPGAGGRRRWWRWRCFRAPPCCPTTPSTCPRSCGRRRGKGPGRRPADLRALPAGGQVISDDPGVVWRAGRRTPPDLVDTSILRIESGRLTAASLARAAADTGSVPCWSGSHRFAT